MPFLARVLRTVPKSIIVVVVLLAALYATGFFLSEYFGTLRNLTNIFKQAAALGFVSLGQTVVVLTGGIDLSVGALISLSSNFTSGFIDGNPNMVLPVVALVIAMGAAIGGVNGYLTHRLGVHPLIITLGMAAILQGAALLYSRAPVGSVPASFQELAYGKFFGLPIGGLVMVALFVAMGIFLNYTASGRAIYMVGGDPAAARLIGVSVRKTLVMAYSISGALAAFTGIYLVSRLGSGDPLRGEGFELASITPVIVGGTILAGGRGGVLGTFLGVYLISMLNNLLNYLDVSTFYQWIIQGVIIIAAVAFEVTRRKRA